MMYPSKMSLTLLGLVILSLVLTSLAQPVGLEAVGRPKRNPWELDNPDVTVRKDNKYFDAEFYLGLVVTKGRRECLFLK